MEFQGKHLSTFPDQISFALESYAQNPVVGLHGTKHVVICGLGGSGIAGRIVKNYFSSRSALIIELVADYTLPANIRQQTLVICSSYSGQTEETLSCYKQAQALGCKILCISSGGQLSDWAAENGHPLYKSVGGMQPRMALGYSLTYLCLILGEIGGVPMDVELRNAMRGLREKEEGIKARSLALMGQLSLDSQKIVHIAVDAPGAAMCIRAQQQLNENSKLFAQVHEVPEMCHNAIEAITGETRMGPWILVKSGKHPRNLLRFDYLEQVLREQGHNYICLELATDSLSALLEGIYLFDWLSLQIAHANRRDSSQIPNILGLKKFLLQ
ncbi:MAG: SIS domain-containing protein [Bacteroidetes bacterium]|jgi:glucose/mannose-6-phosphate isomerase|nr:SIS domain-containing protein [Bacteroidota bacterium]